MSEMSPGAPTPEQPQTPVQGGGQARTPGTPGGVKKRRRGKRGGRNRNKTRVDGAASTPRAATSGSARPDSDAGSSQDIELPDPPREGKMASPQAVEAATVRKPQIGDTRPAPTVAVAAKPAPATGDGESKPKSRNRRGGKRGGRNRRKSSDRSSDNPVVGTDAELIERRRGKERNGKAVGRYMMCVQVRETR